MSAPLSARQSADVAVKVGSGAGRAVPNAKLSDREGSRGALQGWPRRPIEWNGALPTTYWRCGPFRGSSAPGPWLLPPANSAAFS